MTARRALLALLAPVLLVAPGLALPHTSAGAGEPPGVVTLMGSLMSELGCPDDWDGTCRSTDMVRAADGTWSLTGTLPAGSYELKVRYDRSWDENYGAGGAADGPNIPLVLQHTVALRFTHDETTKRTTVAPATPAPGLQPADRTLAQGSLRRDLTRERFYFVMADRFANGDPRNDTGGRSGGRLQHGLDPTHKGFFHGGDLRGLIDRLDYVEGLGTTAIWMTPSFANKPVQGTAGNESAGYHGYWVTDFTRIDPHLGTNAELRELVDKAHARGIKVFFDIITNHTADVLDYEDSAYTAGPVRTVPYRSKAEAPYRDADGRPFDDRAFALGDSFPEVDEGSFPYRPVVPPGQETAKTPSWLNDPTMYHNRGTSTFAGEDAEYGDFPSGDRSALDDLWTERPEVLRGMVDIYSTWVREAGVDGFRIDTVKHVNTEFWQRFGPALQGYAASLGNDDFFMFGEVYDADPRSVSRYTTQGRLQAAVDFGFQGSGVGFAKGRPTTELRELFEADDWYTDADSNAYSLPTFLGNHDMGRVGTFLADDASGTELLARDRLAHELMFLSRGQPVVYYGDEQGFVGDGGDQDAREDMFPSRVASYNDNDLIGTDATTAQANYDATHPLYRHIRALSDLRDRYPALADGAQEHRFASRGAGVYAFSRTSTTERVEHLVASNNAETAKTVTLQTHSPRQAMRQVWPLSRRPLVRTSDAEGRITVTVPALSTLVLRAGGRLPADAARPAPSFRAPAAGQDVGGRAEIGVDVPGGRLTEVTFAYRPAGAASWTRLGTDDNRPYRVFADVRSFPRGTLLEYRAVARDLDGDLGVTSTSALVGDPGTPSSGGGTGAIDPVGPQPGAVSVPGSHGSEMGCPSIITGASGDWEPACDQAQLTLDPTDGIWELATTLPAGTYEYKAALDRSWDVNYGAGAAQNGSNIAYTHEGGPIRFWFDPRTKHVHTDASGPVVVAAGSMQSELGCREDWQPACMATWLQDPDGDGTHTLAVRGLPAGSYELKAAHDLSWTESHGAPGGGNVAFTVPADGLVTEFRYVLATHALSVSTRRDAGGGADLSTSRASWPARDLVVWEDAPPGLRYRLHWGPEGSLAVDDETVGGSSLPLARDDRGLRLSRADARRADEVARSGDVAVAAYDGLGRLVDATSVTVGTWAR